jgi:hypothetical protein
MSHFNLGQAENENPAVVSGQSSQLQLCNNDREKLIRMNFGGIS